MTGVKSGKKEYLKLYIGFLIHQLTQIADWTNLAEFYCECQADQVGPQKEKGLTVLKVLSPCYITKAKYIFSRKYINVGI